MRIRVGILDDHRSFAEALCMALNATSDLECIGIAGSLSEATALVVQRPDVVVLDYRLLNGTGFGVIAEFQDVGAPTRFVMLTAHASPDLRDLAVTAGVSAFLPKNTALADIFETIRSVMAGPSCQPATNSSDGSILSRRQREVLEVMGRGGGPAEIATELFVSIHTARGHVKDILTLMGASTQLEAVTNALRQGYLIAPQIEDQVES